MGLKFLLKEARLLMIILGVSYYTALTIYAGLGEIDRLIAFP